MKTENGSSFFVKIKDYVFFVPTVSIGKNVVLVGDAEKKVTSLDELKHCIKDAKKTQDEIDVVTSSKEEISFLVREIKVVK